jgi:hypothetical protein
LRLAPPPQFCTTAHADPYLRLLLLLPPQQPPQQQPPLLLL